MRYRDPISNQRLTMLTGHIVAVNSQGVTWSYAGRTFGPSPVMAAPLVTATDQDGRPVTIRPPILTGRPCKIMCNLPDYTDAMVIPLAGENEWQG